MSTECGNQHDDEGVPCVCDKTTSNHKLCSGWSARLGDFIDWENPAYTPPKVVTNASAAETKLRSMASKFTGAKDGSEAAAGSWTDTERKVVMSAITEVAERQDEFTTDHVWTALGSDFPRTAGMAAMLQKAVSQGFIEATDKYADSTRERSDHDAGRRLRVWRSRMR